MGTMVYALSWVLQDLYRTPIFFGVSGFLDSERCPALEG